MVWGTKIAFLREVLSKVNTEQTHCGGGCTWIQGLRIRGKEKCPSWRKEGGKKNGL